MIKCVFASQIKDLLARERTLVIPKDVLDILACPECKSPVKLLPDESGLKCVSCRRMYPIRDGIPVMLVEEAIIPKEHRSE